MKTIYYKAGKVINNKVKEFQIYLYICVMPVLNFELDFSNKFQSTFTFILNVFELFKISIDKSIECDHAGLTIDVNLFGLNIIYTNYDTRHWDHENEKWCEYN
jgi:hypothetical protein